MITSCAELPAAPKSATGDSQGANDDAGLDAAGDAEPATNDGVVADGVDVWAAFDFGPGETVGDAAVTDAAADTSGPIAPGETGAPCKTAGDCNSSYCVDGYDGKICTTSCTATNCGAGFMCQQVVTGGDAFAFLCMPKFVHLCEPCLANSDCNQSGETTDVCVSFGDAGSFCGATCDPTANECPGGCGCETVVNAATGAKVKQCVRQGMCSCSNKAIALGLTTHCAVKNAYGSCNGTRSCAASGLTACSAALPAAEACNGVDDDCNGITDDLGASGKCPLVNEFGTCQGTIQACVNGVPKCAGTLAAPEACNGVDDNCDGKTDEGLCDDGVPCTKDTCNTDGSCQHVQLGGLPCDDGSICTQTDKCLSGKCVGGNSLNCDDQDPCSVDTCDPFTGCKHVPASDSPCLDDGLACTADLCKNGKCFHMMQDGLKCVSDGNECTDDVCAGGKCIHPNSSGACDDGNACTANDKCSSGKCLPGPKPTCDDGNPCTLDKCDAGVVGGCVHDANDFVACNSGSADCPLGQCAGGMCYPKANSVCSAVVELSMCGTQAVAGVCTSTGACVPTKKVDASGCTAPCKSYCTSCMGISLCMDFLFSGP